MTPDPDPFGFIINPSFAGVGDLAAGSLGRKSGQHRECQPRTASGLTDVGFPVQYEAQHGCSWFSRRVPRTSSLILRRRLAVSDDQIK